MKRNYWNISSNMYRHIKLSFGDKIKVLFFNLFPENKIINIENKTIINKFQEKNKESINNTTSNDEKEDFRVPFFHDDKNVKTNF